MGRTILMMIRSMHINIYLFYFMVTVELPVANLQLCGIRVDDCLLTLPLVDRTPFLNDDVYQQCLEYVPDLKLVYSSTTMSSLQWTALKDKMPLLNLARQILRRFNILMTPMRVSDGYNSEGKKLFRECLE